MKRFLLYEKFIAPFDDDKKKAKERLEKLGVEITKHRVTKTEREIIHDTAFAIRDWFYGKYMNPRTTEDDIKNVVKLFKKVSEIYHEEKKGQMYRVAQLYVGEKTKDDILNIKKCQPGPKSLQSWSTTKDGAEWFFNHFVKGQNDDDFPRPEKSWVLIKTEAENLEQLLTFEECMQFLYDIGGVLKITPVELLADQFISDNHNEMAKMHELICIATDQIPVDVVEVFVMPKSYLEM